jgi:hypothetical protein
MKPLGTINMREFATKPSKHIRAFEDAGGGFLSRHGEVVGVYIPTTSWGLRNALKVWEWYTNFMEEGSNMDELPEDQQKAIQVWKDILARYEFEDARARQRNFTDRAKNNNRRRATEEIEEGWTMTESDK